MKKLIILIVTSLITATGLFAQKIPFEKFDKSKIDVGTLYVYEYSSNAEGFNPTSKQYLYIKSLTDINIIWIPFKSKKATSSEKYKMNWNYMMFEMSEYISLRNKKDIALGSTYKVVEKIDFKKKIQKYHGFNLTENGFDEKNFVWEFENFPTYFYYQTDLLPLWFTLRFYPFDQEKITVNHNREGYDTELEIKYEGKEKVDVPYGKVLCYKFELIPKLSFFMKIFHSPKKAWIWLSAESNYRYMVKYRNNNERSTFTQSMEYRLAERKKMTLEEWEQFKEKHGAKDTNFTN